MTDIWKIQTAFYLDLISLQEFLEAVDKFKKRSNDG